MKPETAHVQAELEELRRRFEEFRIRGRGTRRLPENLWAALRSWPSAME